MAKTDFTKYVIGSNFVPSWVQSRLMTYRKIDGTIGYEIYIRGVSVLLNAGDTIYFRDGKLTFERTSERKEKIEC